MTVKINDLSDIFSLQFTLLNLQNVIRISIALYRQRGLIVTCHFLKNYIFFVMKLYFVHLKR